ncbi:OmpA family protein [Roseovarius aestuariivivens]|uniref:OmpA family protein n=1 Tax=Roseovarius aestuariivivens TaxID=1888910 RepID=UPI0010803E52|nr:OmpA family protein [Roseovarius aestuariivivens]
MRLSSIFAIAGTFLVAFILCLFAAGFAVGVIEESSRNAVRDTLDEAGMTWTEVDADGLQVFLAGTAPSEATRFKALSIAGTVVESARVIDQMLIEDSADIAPPRFSVEILRNDSGLSLIGLIPASTDREALLDDVRKVAGDETVTDLLETADYPEPETWEDALDYAVDTLDLLPRAKISVDAMRVEIVAMADSDQDKSNLETQLARRLPDDVRLALDISAPRPVRTPFTLRYLLEDGAGRFDACSADTEEARDRILSAAGRAGLADKAKCTLALGVPSPEWATAAEMAIDALARLGGGAVTFSDADITLIAAQGTAQDRFDDVVGGLETNLPEVFALNAVLPRPATDEPATVPEFVATLSPEGLVLLRGRLDSARTRVTVDSFARARFSSDAVNMTARVAEDLPKGWTTRVLAGIEALAFLSNGAVTVTPDEIAVTGNTGKPEASADIAALFARKIGETAQFDIDVTYREALDPVASLPTPEECEQKIAEVQSTRKITFEPGETTIDASGAEIMDDIAEILKQCGEIRMEIGGHTDSQGREVMNQQLSQARAQSILNELRARRVLTSAITAKGYGESRPIADNGTEDGREANRRIEFKVIRPEPIAEEQTTLEALEAEAQKEDPAGDNAEAGTEEEDTGDEQN